MTPGSIAMETRILMLSAAACIIADLLGWRGVVYLTKPLATAAVIALALHVPAVRSFSYRRWIVAGLVCSLVGDVLLMLPSDRFVAGLGAFLVAHLCYITAFARDGGGWRAPAAAAVVAGVVAGMAVLLWPHLGALRWPVVGYMLVIGTMAWQALARWRHLGGPATAHAAVGAACFVCSDGALALRKFLDPFPGATVVVLGTYWVAQWGIARSVASDPQA